MFKELKPNELIEPGDQVWIPGYLKRGGWVEAIPMIIGTEVGGRTVRRRVQPEEVNGTL